MPEAGEWVCGEFSGEFVGEAPWVVSGSAEGGGVSTGASVGLPSRASGAV